MQQNQSGVGETVGMALGHRSTPYPGGIRFHVNPQTGRRLAVDGKWMVKLAPFTRPDITQIVRVAMHWIVSFHHTPLRQDDPIESV